MQHIPLQLQHVYEVAKNGIPCLYMTKENIFTFTCRVSEQNDTVSIYAES